MLVLLLLLLSLLLLLLLLLLIFLILSNNAVTFLQNKVRGSSLPYLSNMQSNRKVKFPMQTEKKARTKNNVYYLPTQPVNLNVFVLVFALLALNIFYSLFKYSFCLP